MATRSTVLRVVACLALGAGAGSCAGAGQTPAVATPGELAAMTPAACAEGAEQLVEQINGMVDATYALLSDARGQQDEATAVCLERKAAMMRGLLTLANQAEIALHDAAQGEQAAPVRSEYLKISLAHAKVKQLELAAGACPSEMEAVPPHR